MFLRKFILLQIYVIKIIVPIRKKKQLLTRDFKSATTVTFPVAISITEL